MRYDVTYSLTYWTRVVCT